MNIQYVAPVVKDFRVDLSNDPEFTAKGFGKKLKALGGQYSECRGMETTRFLTVPNTPAGRSFAEDAIRVFGGSRRRGVKSTTIVLHAGSSSVRNVYQVKDETVCIDEIMKKFEGDHLAWWHKEGREEAVARAEREAQYLAERKAEAPAQVGKAILSALELGCDKEQIMEAVRLALGAGQ
jgi:hypothetical protein